MPVVKMYSHCLPRIDNIKLWGNAQSKESQVIQVRLLRCEDRKTCKSDKEIDEFIDKNGHIVMLYNNQRYQKEDYTEEVI